MSNEVVPGMAEAVENRRRALGLSPGGFAEATGLTRQASSNVRTGKRRAYQDDTIFGVARALRWKLDWYDRLTAGKKPVEDTTAPAGDTLERLDRLEVGQKDIAARLDGLSDRLDQVLSRLERGPR